MLARGAGLVLARGAGLVLARGAGLVPALRGNHKGLTLRSLASMPF